jgi:hypothetical protein
VLAILFLQAITGAHTPTCLFTTYNPVETVTPPSAAHRCAVCLSLDLTESRSSGQKKAARTASVRAGRPVTQLVVLNLIRSREPCFDPLRHRLLTPQSEPRIPVFWRFSSSSYIFSEIFCGFLQKRRWHCPPGRPAVWRMLPTRHEYLVEESAEIEAERRVGGAAGHSARRCSRAGYNA